MFIPCHEEICATVCFSTKGSGKNIYGCVCLFGFEALHTHMDFTARQKGFCFRFLYELQQGSPSHWGFGFFVCLVGSNNTCISTVEFKVE